MNSNTAGAGDIDNLFIVCSSISVYDLLYK